MQSMLTFIYENARFHGSESVLIQSESRPQRWTQSKEEEVLVRSANCEEEEKKVAKHIF